MGGTYVDALELLRQAAGVRAINCPVKFDALPKPPTVKDMLAHGKPSTSSGRDGDSNRFMPGLYDDANINREQLAAVSK
jgi:hypothetical protein